MIARLLPLKEHLFRLASLLCFAAFASTFVLDGGQVIELIDRLRPAAYSVKNEFAMVILRTAFLCVALCCWNHGRIVAFVRHAVAISPEESVALLLLLGLYSACLVFPILSPIYDEDGPLETLTVVFALSAAAFLLRSSGSAQSSLARAVFVVGAAAMFVFAMEEISWGQRIFGWQTPADWAMLNRQGETNLHNLYNPYFPIGYAAFNLAAFAFMKWSQHSVGRIPQELKPLLCNGNEHFASVVFLALAAQSFWFIGGELTEEIVAAIVCFRSMAAYRQLRRTSPYPRALEQSP